MAIKNTLSNNEAIQPNTAFIQTLQKHFPQFFTAKPHSEHSVESPEFDIEKFKTELAANNIHEAKDGYALNFVGKDYARLLSGQASETVIIPDNDHNAKPENANSENVFITGDNLEALRHLQNAYSGAVKMIYIDPPYNTGKEFVYNDKFSFTDEKLKTALGYTDKEIERLKSLQGKSSHSAWLTFMYPRLKIAQNLLTDDGVIFISIDDNEQANLKLLMDDIFGEGNFVGTLPTIMNLKGNNDEFGFAGTHEYTVVYSKNKFHSRFREFSITEEEIDDWEIDEIGYFKRGANLKSTGVNAPRSKRPNLYFPIYITSSNECNIYRKNKTDVEIYPITNNNEMSWRWGKEKFQNESHNIIISKDGDNISVYKKQRPSLGDLPSKKPKTLLYKPQYSSGNGTQQIKNLFDSKPFSNPKPLDLIKDLFEVGSDVNSLILDFFAGSGTTAHAVMQLNAEDGGNRKYIMVQWAETTNVESEAYKSGYKTIDEISRERIKRAAKKIKAENLSYAEKADLGFKHYRLQEPQVQTIDKIVEFNPNIQQLFAEDMVAPFAYKPTNTSGLQTILQTWLIQDGYKFNIQAEAINLAGYEAQYVNQTLYLVNTGFTHEALKTLLNKIGKNELIVNTVIVYPYSFSFEQMRELKYNIKTNVEQQVTIIERY